MPRTLLLPVTVLLVLAAWWWWPGDAGPDPARSIASKPRLSPASSSAVSGATAGTPRIVVAAAPDAAVARIGEKLPPPGTPLTQMYTPLRRMAEAGNAAAACRLAFELNECRTQEEKRGSVAFWERRQEEARAQGKNPAEFDLRISEARKRAAQRETACAGFPLDETLLAWDFTLAAALAGNREARWMAGFFPAGLDFVRPENTLEGWMQWRENIAGILEAGVRDGDPRMFRLAASAYTKIEWGTRIHPEDRERGVAFMFALRDAASPAYRAAAERDADFFLDRWFKDDPAARARIEAIARSLPPIRHSASGGIDWTRGMAPDRDGTQCERP